MTDLPPLGSRWPKMSDSAFRTCVVYATTEEFRNLIPEAGPHVHNIGKELARHLGKRLGAGAQVFEASSPPSPHGYYFYSHQLLSNGWALRQYVAVEPHGLDAGVTATSASVRPMWRVIAGSIATGLYVGGLFGIMVSIMMKLWILAGVALAAVVIGSPLAHVAYSHPRRMDVSRKMLQQSFTFAFGSTKDDFAARRRQFAQ